MAWAQVASLTYNQNDNGGTGSGNMDPAAINTTGATILIASLSMYNAGGSLAISDTVGGNHNTWTARTTYNGGNSQTTISYVLSPFVGASHTFHIAYTAPATYGCFCLLALSGGGSAYDTENGGGSTVSSTTFQPGSVTPAQTGELLVTAVCVGGVVSGTISINLSYSAITEFDPNGNCFAGGLAWLGRGDASASNPTWTFPTSPRYSAAIAAFKNGGAAAGPSAKIVQANQSIITASYW